MYESVGRTLVDYSDTWLRTRRIRCRIQLGERKRMRAFTVYSEIRQTLLCLLERWNMASRYPPQRVIHAVESLEPRLALAHDLDMGRAVNKCTQLLGTFPDG